MNNKYFIVLSIVIMLYIINIVRKKKFSIKESFWWIIASIGMLLLSIFPYSINYFAKKLGIAYPPALLFVLCIVFLLFINFRSNKKIAEQQLKIIELAQELAILKEKVNRNEK